MYPGLVWMSLHFAQAKVNWLTHDVGDALIGTPEYKVSAVRVESLRHVLDGKRPIPPRPGRRAAAIAVRAGA